MKLMLLFTISTVALIEKDETYKDEDETYAADVEDIHNFNGGTDEDAIIVFIPARKTGQKYERK